MTYAVQRLPAAVHQLALTRPDHILKCHRLHPYRGPAGPGVCAARAQVVDGEDFTKLRFQRSGRPAPRTAPNTHHRPPPRAPQSFAGRLPSRINVPRSHKVQPFGISFEQDPCHGRVCLCPNRRAYCRRRPDEDAMKAVRIYEQGGPEVLRYEEVPTPEPGPGEARARLVGCGVNFVDIYQRSGQYRLALPVTLGQEGAGVVDAVGPDVTEVKVGDHVVFANVMGSYAQYVAAPAWRLVPVPVGLDDRLAGSAMLHGMTAHYLTAATYPLRSGDAALVHAGAGGVGQLLVPMGKRRGARVIAPVSTDR